MLVTAWNVNAGIQILQRNEVLIWETKFRRCYNIWPQGGCVCVRVWWQRVSVPPSLKLMSKPGLHKTCGRKSWEVRLMITSRDDIPVRMFESQGYRVGSGKWERREQQPCGWDGKVGRHCLRWPVQVLQLLNVHTLSCLGDWVAFSGLTLDLKLWMCDGNLLFCFCYLACCFPTSLLRRGDIWWLLEGSACWITFVNSFFSLKYLLLLEQPDCDTCVHYRKQCGPVEWVDSFETWQIYHRLTWETVLFWTGLLPVFFLCKTVSLERLKKFQDLLGAHSKNLCLVIYQLGGRLTVLVDFIVLFNFSLPKQSQGILFCFQLSKGE